MISESERRLQNWQTLSDEASHGPWKVVDEYVGDDRLIAWQTGDGQHVITTDHIHASDVGGSPRTDAAFIAEARTALPEAIAEIRRLRSELEWYGDEANWRCLPQTWSRPAQFRIEFVSIAALVDEGERARTALGLPEGNPY